MRFIGYCIAFLTILSGFSAAASAHVKWFAPYIVEASPRPIGYTLTDIWFWTGLVMVLIFFAATRLVERTTTGNTIQHYLDRATDPLWLRLDDFIKVVIGVFFVAIFAVGGVYLTPDLKTSSEWISWSQLLIAALVFSRRTQPLAAAGIIGLWLLALRDYQLFHMLDYLALGVGVAAYLVLEASSNEDLRKHRLTALRVGVAIALMWSSLEKFGYPDWFYPLVEEKPFLTFGIPRDAFIPMAGLAEFTMGFGLLWTPLIRRLSAIALFIIFTAAVYPFGRIDLVGHALIMAIIVAIIADHSRGTDFLPRVKEKLAGIPLGLTAALILFVGAYWGSHALIYGVGNVVTADTSPMTTHTFDPDHPHDTGAVGGETALEAYQRAMEVMHTPMMDGIRHPNPDMAFVLGMLPHHVGATDMAEIQLRYGSDPQMKDLAERILKSQHGEIEEMRAWLKARNYEFPDAKSSSAHDDGHH
ncbi:MAG: DUF305 domain-containing protein [Micavibrio aeruginosavorus]|uniref:DUF305 domain-containing protein n=1 Tax=Micavibrio aeruginosavorus TaxID=349221 RepID=A0A2W5C040_9BACT|nr:MAG: DUF305 domain-containing protein [Micavibrio aeruginosavorus]